MSLRPRVIVPSLLLLATATAHAAPPGGEIPWIVEKDPKEGTVRIAGLVQSWVTVMDQDEDPLADPATYGDPENDPGFSLQRGRLGASGLFPRAYKLVQASWSVGVGVGAPYDFRFPADYDAQIIDAYGEVLLANEFGPTALSLGVQKVPFSRDQLMSARDLTFQDRHVASAHFGQTRDVGAILSQGILLKDGKEDLGVVALRLGAFNGNQDIYGDDDPGKLLAARGELAIGRAYQTFDPALKPALGVAVNVLNDDERATNTMRYGADLLGRYKWITATGEFLMGSVGPGDPNAVDPGVSETIRQMGYAAQLSVFVPIEEEQGGPEFAARFAGYDDDRDQSDLGDVQILTAGLNWRGVTKGVDVGAGYVMRLEGGPTELQNDTVRLWVQLRPTYDVL